MAGRFDHPRHRLGDHQLSRLRRAGYDQRPDRLLVLVAPSLLSADFSRLGEEVAALEQAGAGWVHFDVMDGHFVPPITIGPRTVEHCRRYAKLPFDIHLMIESPERTIDAFRDAGADSVSVHVEATRHIHRVLDSIRRAGLRPMVCLNPVSPLVL